MAKKFMYVCIGIMALAVTFHVGAQYGKASIVDPTPSGIVAQYSPHVLVENGEVYRWEQDHWLHLDGFDVPLPVSDIKFWTAGTFVTQAGEVWYVGEGSWENVGSPPVGPTPTPPSTWGKIKAKFQG